MNFMLMRCKQSQRFARPERHQRAKNSMKDSPIPALLLTLIAFSLPACNRLNGQEEKPAEEHQKITVTCPEAKDVTITQQYVCQIHSQRHINVCAFVNGYLQDVLVREGQSAKQGAVMFAIRPVIYKAKLDAASAEAQVEGIELTNSQKLFDQKVVSHPDVALHQAKLAKAEAEANLAKA